MEEYIDYIILGVAVLINVLSAVLTTLKNFKNGKGISNIESEMMCMKCRLPDYDTTKQDGTTFRSKIDNYAWNDVTKNVEKDGTIRDLQKEIESYADCALERMLEKFNLDPNTLRVKNEDPSKVTLIDDIADMTEQAKEDLTYLSDAQKYLEDVNSSYGQKFATLKDATEWLKEQYSLSNQRLKAIQEAMKGSVKNGETKENIEAQK